MQKRDQTSWYGSRSTFAFGPLAFHMAKALGLAGEDAYGKSSGVLLPQRLCQWHLFALFCKTVSDLVQGKRVDIP
jgi:hypothetical protein